MDALRIGDRLVSQNCRVVKSDSGIKDRDTKWALMRDTCLSPG
jgi:hypothetical protein